MPMTGANMASVDMHDQSLPLTLYEKSYTSVDPAGLPDGGPWSLLDVCMRPALHSAYHFTPTNDIAYIPYIAMGTPVSYLQFLHQWWRGSMRMQLHFFASAFTSARFLIVWTPTISESNQSLTDTISQVVDVRGDTVVSFTLPYLSETDYLPLTIGGSSTPASVGTLQVSLYNDIVTADNTTDPVVDLVVFSATDADFQFHTPVIPQATADYPFVYSYPNVTVPAFAARAKSSVQEQCDIRAEFKASFPPIVAGCSHYADNSYVATENPRMILDYMKRYQSVLPNSSAVATAVLPGQYAPESTTIGAWLVPLFGYWRGGLRYKVVNNETPTMMAARFGDTSTDAYFASGTACLIQTNPANVLDFSAPWTDLLPFRVQGSVNTIQWPVDVPSPDDCYYYVAVRDDYSVGFLIPPGPQSGSLASRRARARVH